MFSEFSSRDAHLTGCVCVCEYVLKIYCEVAQKFSCITNKTDSKGKQHKNEYFKQEEEKWMSKPKT